MNPIWKQPARLCRRRENPVASVPPPAAKQLASGSLEDMVREAIARGASAPERQALFIDVGTGKAGSDTVLAWSEIRKLRRSPSFPVEI